MAQLSWSSHHHPAQRPDHTHRFSQMLPHKHRYCTLHTLSHSIPIRFPNGLLTHKPSLDSTGSPKHAPTDVSTKMPHNCPTKLPVRLYKNLEAGLLQGHCCRYRYTPQVSTAGASARSEMQA